jgi:ABC-type enterochelin transport system permease subunit
MGRAMKFGHDTLMGIGLVASGGLTFAYTRVPSKTLLTLTLIGAAVTIIIGVLLFFGLA